MYRIARYYVSVLGLLFFLSLTAFAADFTTKHTLYVGCSEASSYAQLSDAVAAAKPYTLIKVCAGEYEGGSASYTDFLKIEGQGKAGSAVINCGLGGSAGIQLYGKYNWVSNLEFDDCGYGVFSSTYDNAGGRNSSNQVSNSIFNGDDYPVYVEYCDGCQVTDNKITEGADEISDSYTTRDVISGNQIVGCADTGIYPSNDDKLTVINNKVTECYYGYYDEAVSNSYIANNDFSCNGYIGIELYGDDFSSTFKNNTTDDNLGFGIWVGNPNGGNVGLHTRPNKFTKDTSKGNGTDDFYDATAAQGCTDTDGTCNTWENNKAYVCYPSGICP